MYLIPVGQFLMDVPMSYVSNYVTPPKGLGCASFARKLRPKYICQSSRRPFRSFTNICDTRIELKVIFSTGWLYGYRSSAIKPATEHSDMIWRGMRYSYSQTRAVCNAKLTQPRKNTSRRSVASTINLSYLTSSKLNRDALNATLPLLPMLASVLPSLQLQISKSR